MEKQRSWTHRLAFLTLAIWLAFSNSCNFPVPGPWQATETAVPTGSVQNTQAAPTVRPTSQAAAASPVPTQPPVPLPPALVETNPLPLSDIGPKAAFTFYFNQPMERASVQDALQSIPVTAGSFKWTNDATVVFTPDQPLPAGSSLQVSFSTKARAASGLAMSAPVDVPFKVSNGFQVADQLPKPGAANVSPTSAVVVTFTRPITALGADPKSLPAAFSLEPAAQGRGEWLNTSTYIFYPEPPLLGGSEYSVRLNTGLGAADGSTWASGSKPADWKFKTAAPLMTALSPDVKNPVALDAGFSLTFNQSMDAASVQQALTLKENGGAGVEGKYSWNETGTQVTFQPVQLLKRSVKYTLALAGKAQARGGSALGKDASWNYTAMPDFGVKSSEPSNGGTLSQYGGIRIQFTTPLAKQNLYEKITFNPPLADASITNYAAGTDVYISFVFTPRTEYTLTLQPGLQDKWGQALKEPVVLHFTSPAPVSSLALAESSSTGVLFITPSDAALAGRATNIKTIRVGYAGLSAAEFARMATISGYERISRYSGPKLTNFDKTVSLPRDQNVAVDIPLTAAGKALPSGLYFYQIQSPEVTDKSVQAITGQLVVVSRVHLALKLSQNQLTAWAVNLEDQQPLKGAALTVYTSGKAGELTQVGTLQTDGQGVASLEYAFPPNSYTPVYVVLGKPGEANFSLAMSNWTEGLSPWEMGVAVDYGYQPLQAYLYTDRPIYQPGQTVDFRVLVHQKNNGRYTASGLKQVTVKVWGEYSRTTGERSQLYQAVLPLSEYGTAQGAVELPEGASPGYYTLEVAEVAGSAIGFQVANYRKPEIELKAIFGAADLRAGQEMNATIQANYYFGAPAGELNLHWALYTQSSWFALAGGYQNGGVDTSWLLPRSMGFGFEGLGNKLIAEGTLRTTPDGKAALKAAGQAYLDAVGTGSSSTQRIRLEVTLQDEQELPVSTQTTATVHPADYYIGLRSEAWSGQAKREAGFAVQTFAWDRSPVGSRKLTALFEKVVYKQKADWNWQAGTPSFTVEKTKIGSTDFQVDGQGQARIAFTPPEPGTYQVQVSGDGALSQVMFWVGGEGRAPWPAMPNKQIRVLSDASEYQPGTNAKIFIPNPMGEKALALITVERGLVMQSEVVQINGANLEWTLPVTDMHAPNVFVSVILVGKGEAGEPDFRAGVVQVKVAPKALTLQVEAVTAPATAAPGGEVKIALRVKDGQGKAVQGEFSLAVVDKAVLALADANAEPIQSAYYGPQGLGVTTSLSLAVFGRPRTVLAQAAAGGRGGGGGDAQAPALRANFQDTAYWKGAIVTDANGLAEVTVKLPDNLTTWVITARGLTRDLRVGEAVQELVVSKDLLIRPVTPRFLVAGDRIQLGATVNNNTAKGISVEVGLQAAGLDLEDPAKATQKIDLPAQGRARVTWWARVQSVEKVELTFSARGGGLEDAARPAGGSIPVLRYSVPQTFATGGVLTEAGERLEVISAPRSFQATGGELRVELSPSVAAAVLSGLRALEDFPLDYAEPVVSRLLPNLAAYQALQKLSLEAPADLRERLQSAIQTATSRLAGWQNKDGGWGWAPDRESDPYLSAYVLFGLSEAARAGGFVNQAMLKKAGDYLVANLVAPTVTMKAAQLDRLAYLQYVLQRAGSGQKSAAALFDHRDRLSPWGRAMLALTLNAQNSADTRARDLLSDLQGTALRSATGAHWETRDGMQQNLGSPVFATAVVSLALARLDPAAAILTDAVRYLTYNRRASGCWATSYESAWVLMALTEVMQATGELSASFAYSAVLNGTPLASGQAGGPNALTAVSGSTALRDLKADMPNALKILHEPGAGRLYYRAFLQVYRPVEQALPLERGLALNRRIYLAGQDCTKAECKTVSTVKLSDQRELLVRLTLTLPEAMYNLAVEDFIPAGAEIVDTSLKTVKQSVSPQPGTEPVLQYRLENPFGGGWNWWLFGTPKIYNDHIRWTAPYLAAGTYELTYRLTSLQAGEFRLIPAHAYQVYFPEVEGTSAGAIFRIEP